MYWYFSSVFIFQITTTINYGWINGGQTYGLPYSCFNRDQGSENNNKNGNNNISPTPATITNNKSVKCHGNLWLYPGRKKQLLLRRVFIYWKFWSYGRRPTRDKQLSRWRQPTDLSPWRQPTDLSPWRQR